MKEKCIRFVSFKDKRIIHGPFHTLEENHFESLLNDDLPKKKVYDRVGTTPKSSGTFEKRSERLGSSLFIITQT